MTAQGVFFGVGVGPGDPELITVKALKTIQESDVIAFPGAQGRGGKRILVYEIAKAACPTIESKEIVELHLPVAGNEHLRATNRAHAGKCITQLLETGKNVSFLALGDPSLYSTFTYLQSKVREAGFDTRVVSGVMSFSAAAALSGCALADTNEPLHVIPASYTNMTEALALPGTKVLMKTGYSIVEMRNSLKEVSKTSNISIVENCGLEHERIWTLDEINEEHHPGYFTVVIITEHN